MISRAKVLMLDEPTDHLDMESIDALNRGMIKILRRTDLLIA